MNSQIILVISSPSSSTIGFLTFIFAFFVSKIFPTSKFGSLNLNRPNGNLELLIIFPTSLLFILIYQINLRFKELELLKDSSDIIMVLIFTLIFGILASVISSYLVTQKYLNLKTSEQL